MLAAPSVFPPWACDHTHAPGAGGRVGRRPPLHPRSSRGRPPHALGHTPRMASPARAFSVLQAQQLVHVCLTLPAVRGSNEEHRFALSCVIRWVDRSEDRGAHPAVGDVPRLTPVTTIEWVLEERLLTCLERSLGERVFSDVSEAEPWGHVLGLVLVDPRLYSLQRLLVSCCTVYRVDTIDVHPVSHLLLSLRTIAAPLPELAYRIRTCAPRSYPRPSPRALERTSDSPLLGARASCALR